jgi:hypothetical protein
MSDNYKPGLKESATYTRSVIDEIQRAAKPGFMTFAAGAQNAKSLILTICCSWVPACHVPARRLP